MSDKSRWEKLEAIRSDLQEAYDYMRELRCDELQERKLALDGGWADGGVVTDLRKALFALAGCLSHLRCAIAKKQDDEAGNAAG